MCANSKLFQKYLNNYEIFCYEKDQCTVRVTVILHSNIFYFFSLIYQPNVLVFFGCQS